MWFVDKITREIHNTYFKNKWKNKWIQYLSYILRYWFQIFINDWWNIAHIADVFMNLSFMIIYFIKLSLAFLSFGLLNNKFFWIVYILCFNVLTIFICLKFFFLSSLLLDFIFYKFIYHFNEAPFQSGS